MNFFKFFERPSEGKTETEEEIRKKNESKNKNEVERIYKLEMHISIDRVPADDVIENKLEIDKDKLIEKIGKEKYDELLMKVKDELGLKKENV